MLLALALTQNASAIQVVGEQGNAASPSLQAASVKREGVIQKIDLGSKTMVVDGVSYGFSIATTIVHDSRLLALRKNDRIRFKLLNDSGKERITEIWLIPPTPR